MSAGVISRPLDLGFVLRGSWYAFVAFACLYMAATAPWDNVGVDFSRYLAGSRGLWAGDAYTGTGLLYSPAFAVLVTPLTWLPFEVALNLWRIAELAALVLVLRGAPPLAWAALLIPGLWWSELVGCNVMGFGTAAMIAVLRWPSVRSVTLYALMVAIIPKPAFLPVMAWGFVVVPEARRYVLAIGAFGAVMLLWPGYVHAAISTNEGHLANFRWPQPWGYVAAAVLTLVGLRYTRLLGVAAFVATPYVFPYSSTVIGASAVTSPRAVSRRSASPLPRTR